MSARRDLDLTQAVGACVVSWANIESRLFMLFTSALGSDSLVIADAIFASPRSFEARSTMVHAVVKIRLDGRPALHDWNLLFNHVLRLNGMRNEVVHATQIEVTGKGVLLQPYFRAFKKLSPLTAEDVARRAEQFIELDRALAYFLFAHFVRPKMPPTIPLEPEPRLLRRLRTQDAQRREGQRAQQKPLNQ